VHDDVVAAVLRACERADARQLTHLFAPSISLVADGGARVTAAVEPVQGADVTAHLLLETIAAQPGVALATRSVNGQPAIVLVCDATVTGVICLDTRGDLVHSIWLILNPDKLFAINRSRR